MRQKAGLALTGGFGNTPFVGLPMIESLHGRDGMPLGLLMDPLCSCLAQSTIGIAAAALYAAEGPVQPPAMLRRLVTFPPFVALLAALLRTPVPMPPVIEQALARMGDTLTLLSVGMQLRLGALHEHRRALCLGLGCKLLLCPAGLVGLLWLCKSELSLVTNVSVIQAAMPPLIGAAVVASQALRAPGLVSLMAGVGIPLRLITVPAWFRIFGVLGR
jgi:predicted permease